MRGLGPRILLTLVAFYCVGFEWEGRLGRLLRELRSPDAGRRADVARRLGEWPADEVGGVLLATLDDEDLSVRLSAIESLGRARVRAAAPRLSSLLSAEVIEERAAAVRALGHLGDPSVIPAVVRVLGDTRSALRRAAAVALGRIGGADAISPLIGRLDDTDASVRAAAAQALGAAGPEARSGLIALVARLRDDAPEVRVAVVDALGELGDAGAVAALVTSLGDANDDVRSAAAAALARIAAPDSASALALYARGDDERLARGAVAALGRVPGPEALESLIAALDRAGTRAVASDALLARSEREPLEVEAALSAALEAAAERDVEGHDVGHVALALARVAEHHPELGALAGPAIAQALSRRRGDPATLLDALAATGDASALLPLLEALGDSDPALRAHATRALAALWERVEPDGRAADPLLLALERATPTERPALLRLLGEVGAARALPAVRALLDDDDLATRVAAIDAAGALGDAGSAEPLFDILGARDASVRHHAARALGRTADAAALARLLDGVVARAPTDRHAWVLAIGLSLSRIAGQGRLDAALRTRARDALLTLAQHQDRALAAEALAALSRWGDPSLATPLVALAQAATPSQRAAYASTLGAFAEPDAQAALAAMADGSTGEACVVATSRLGEHGDARAAHALLEAAPSLPWPTSAAAAFSLARFAARGVLRQDDAPALCALAASHDPWVRANVASALAHLGARCASGPAPEDWLDERHAAVVRAAAARWAGALGTAERALGACAAAPTEDDATRACADPSLPPMDDLLDVVAWDASGRERLVRALVVLRLADGSALLSYTDHNGGLRLWGAPRGAATLDDPFRTPLEP